MKVKITNKSKRSKTTQHCGKFSGKMMNDNVRSFIEILTLNNKTLLKVKATAKPSIIHMWEP